MYRFSTLLFLIALQLSYNFRSYSADSASEQLQFSSLEDVANFIDPTKAAEIVSFVKDYSHSSIEQTSNLPDAKITTNGKLTKITIKSSDESVVTVDFIGHVLRTVQRTSNSKQITADFYESGILSQYAEGRFGKFDGIVLKLYKTGRLQYIIHCSEGLLLGRSISWGEEGDIKFDKNYNEPTAFQ